MITSSANQRWRRAGDGLSDFEPCPKPWHHRGMKGNGEFIPTTAHVECLRYCEGGTRTYLQQIPSIKTNDYYIARKPNPPRAPPQWGGFRFKTLSPSA